MERLFQHIYRQALERTRPERLVVDALDRCGRLEADSDLVAIGKCAAGLMRGAAEHAGEGRRLVIVPEDQIEANPPFETVAGSHPEMTAASFAAGRRLLEFVRSGKRPATFLISGGASAVAEVPLGPWFCERDLAEINTGLVRSGFSIHEMNIVRKHLSAIKGGRLAASLGSVPHTTLVFSDAADGALADVGSGPTLPDDSTNDDAAILLRRLEGPTALRLAAALQNGDVPETPKALPPGGCCLIADNATLTGTACEVFAQQGVSVQRSPTQLEGNVEEVARHLARTIASLRSREVLVAGGEPTVKVSGNGKGGRCLELAVRFARACAKEGIESTALFGSSDGRDGNSGVAGAVITAGRASWTEALERALEDSDSLRAIPFLGQPIMMPPTGNNLRDVYFLVRKPA